MVLKVFVKPAEAADVSAVTSVMGEPPALSLRNYMRYLEGIISGSAESCDLVLSTDHCTSLHSDVTKCPFRPSLITCGNSKRASTSRRCGDGTCRSPRATVRFIQLVRSYKHAAISHDGREEVAGIPAVICRGRSTRERGTCGDWLGVCAVRV